MDLRLADDELASCVSCGLCLPHCPTFRVTGEEGFSPRGRIAAMRSVQWDGAEAGGEFVRFMETCVQCRGCEPACPSGVPFGHLMEGTRRALASEHRTTSRLQRIALGLLDKHRLLLAGSSALALAQRARLAPRRLGLPRLAVRRPPAIEPTATAGGTTTTTNTTAAGLEGDGGEAVWMFTGCVMDAWMRPTHVATKRVIEAAGGRVEIPGREAACCGALHIHAGLHEPAVELARRVIASMPGEAPIVVNSAGCGAAMKDYGNLVGTADARAFSERVLDVHEWVAARLDRLPAPTRTLGPVIVQDPCHLRHVQKAHASVRAVLARVADVVELDDEGLCCGAGGAYSALEPELAGEIRDRKLASIARASVASGATVVASANPGCAMHLAAAGIAVRHPMDLVAEVLP